MAPVKFDDISKVAKDILNDDYSSGYQLKAKQKTSWDGAVVTTAVDLFPSGAKDVQTPAKMTWKLPAPLGFGFCAVDKLEMDKGGKFKFEASSTKVLSDIGLAKCKLDVKSDLENPAKVSAAVTYSGMKDMLVKFETKPMKPADFGLEVTREQAGLGTVGLKLGAASLASPDIGFRMQQGPIFASLIAQDVAANLVLTAHGHYKVSSELQVAGEYVHGGKKTGSYTFGVLYDVMKGVALRAKVSQDKSISVGVKSEVQKGFNVLFGCKYELANAKLTPGLHLQIE